MFQTFAFKSFDHFFFFFCTHCVFCIPITNTKCYIIGLFNFYLNILNTYSKSFTGIKIKLWVQFVGLVLPSGITVHSGHMPILTGSDVANFSCCFFSSGVQ